MFRHLDSPGLTTCVLFVMHLSPTETGSTPTNRLYCYFAYQELASVDVPMVTGNCPISEANVFFPLAQVRVSFLSNASKNEVDTGD